MVIGKQMDQWNVDQNTLQSIGDVTGRCVTQTCGPHGNHNVRSVDSNGFKENRP